MNNKINPFQDEGFLIRKDELNQAQAAGHISGLALFEDVRLSQAGVKWRAPFVYTRDGVKTFEAFKIQRDPAFRIIVKLWSVYGPGVLVVTEYRNGRINVMREIVPFGTQTEKESGK